MEDNFTNLHVHSMKGSLLDGLISIPSLFQKAKDLGQKAVAITDHGLMSAMVDAANESKKSGVKFIPGCEVYWTRDATLKGKDEKADENDISRNHLILLAKNNEGYKRLMKICSWGCVEGYYYRPRIDDSVLERFGTEGIIASSACIASIVDQYILKSNYEAAKQKALYYKQLFHDDFYIELQPHNNEKQEIANKGLIQLATELKMPLIITSDAHYLNDEDKYTHDMLLCIQSKKLLNDPKRWRFEPGFYYIMNRNDIINKFLEYHSYIDREIIEEAANNTVKIAEESNVEFDFSKHYLPQIDPYVESETNPQVKKEFDLFESRRLMEIAKRENTTLEHARDFINLENEYIKFLCIHGWRGLYKQHFLDERHLSLMMYELDVIIGMGMSSYFLIMYEVMEWCAHPTGENNNYIPIGPGRGCFKGNNDVMLERGKVHIQDVEIGDRILGLDGEYHQVVDKYKYNCDEDLLVIKTENGVLNGITYDHKVLAVKNDDLQWYPVNELDEGDYITSI